MKKILLMRTIMGMQLGEFWRLSAYNNCSKIGKNTSINWFSGRRSSLISNSNAWKMLFKARSPDVCNLSSCVVNLSPICYQAYWAQEAQSNYAILQIMFSMLLIITFDQASVRCTTASSAPKMSFLSICLSFWLIASSWRYYAFMEPKFSLS